MLIIALVALAALALTNPSYEELKPFTPERSTNRHYVQRTKLHNYLLWSLYRKEVFERESTDDDFSLVVSRQYRGILLNFTSAK